VSATDFDPIAVFGALAEHRVKYVVIGGLAAVIHGSPAFTGDADICPARTPENLERLAAALRDLDPRIRNTDVPDGVEFACDAAFLARMTVVNLVTRFGIVDIAFEPAATRGYDDLVQRAIVYSLGGVEVPVASLRDVIRSKEKADRDKDRAVLPILYALEDEIAAQEAGEAGTK
jgi:hypothetical protein